MCVIVLLLLQMLDYNVPGGKLNRGLSVVDGFKLLKEGRELSDDEVFQSCALGWCIEWVWLNNDSSSCRIFFSAFITSLTKLTLLFFEICSFKHIFSFLMILWMALIHVGVNPAGSDNQRCELLTRAILLVFFVIAFKILTSVIIIIIDWNDCC